jgi:holo-[acyl-carrier protein] synthase
LIGEHGSREEKRKKKQIPRYARNDNSGSADATDFVAIGAQRVAPLQGEALIIGMGVDLAEVGRIRAAIERHGEPFLRRVYTAGEREYCERFKNKYERYAGRFAAKEAAMKALGTGWRRGVRWVDFEVVRELGGRPTIRLDGEARKIAEELGVKRIALSITHTEAQALAQVIFEG